MELLLTFEDFRYKAVLQSFFCSEHLASVDHFSIKGLIAKNVRHKLKCSEISGHPNIDFLDAHLAE